MAVGEALEDTHEAAPVWGNMRLRGLYGPGNGSLHVPSACMYIALQVHDTVRAIMSYCAQHMYLPSRHGAAWLRPAGPPGRLPPGPPPAFYEVVLV